MAADRPAISITSRERGEGRAGAGPLTADGIGAALDLSRGASVAA